MTSLLRNNLNTTLQTRSVRQLFLPINEPDKPPNCLSTNQSTEANQTTWLNRPHSRVSEPTASTICHADVASPQRSSPSMARKSSTRSGSTGFATRMIPPPRPRSRLVSRSDPNLLPQSGPTLTLSKTAEEELQRQLQGDQNQ